MHSRRKKKGRCEKMTNQKDAIAKTTTWATARSRKEGDKKSKLGKKKGKRASVERSSEE